jgi:hypothetical protein
VWYGSDFLSASADRFTFCSLDLACLKYIGSMPLLCCVYPDSVQSLKSPNPTSDYSYCHPKSLAYMFRVEDLSSFSNIDPFHHGSLSESRELTCESAWLDIGNPNLNAMFLGTVEEAFLSLFEKEMREITSLNEMSRNYVCDMFN